MKSNGDYSVDLMAFKRYQALTNSTSRPFQSIVDTDHGTLGFFGGLHGGSRWHLNATLCMLFDRSELYSPSYDKPVFLDLGSGTGVQVIYAAHFEWQAYGIDFSRVCYDAAQQNIQSAERAGFIPEKGASIALGDFFPPDFDCLGRWKDSAVTTLDRVVSLASFDRRLNRSGFSRCFQREIQDHNLEAAGCDPYKKLGIDLAEVDLFYHYQVERCDRILKLFAERAKVGAWLLFARSLPDHPRPRSNVILVGKDQNDILKLYRK